MASEYFGAAPCEAIDDRYECVAASRRDGSRQCVFKTKLRTCAPLNKSAAVIVRDLETARTAAERKRAFKRMQRLLALTRENPDFAFADVGHQIAEVIASDVRLQRLVQHQLEREAKESKDQIFIEFVKYGIPALIAIGGVYYGWDTIVEGVTQLWNNNRDAITKLKDDWYRWYHGFSFNPNLVPEPYVQLPDECDPDYCKAPIDCPNLICKGCSFCK